MAVKIEFPNANNIIQYTPAWSGDITALNFAGYIKGLNYYEYIFYVRLNPGGSFIIDKAPNDNMSRAIASALCSSIDPLVSGLDVNCDPGTIYISFNSFALAATEVYLRIITFDF